MKKRELIKKRKLISFFMVVCMLAMTILTACESGESADDITHRRAATLVIYYIVGDSTTPEAVAEVEEALNEISQSRFTTKIVLRALKASEYHDAVNRAFEHYDEEVAKAEELESIRRSSDRASRDQAREDRAAGIPTERTQRPTEPPRTTALYTQRIEWPEIQTEQIDIFLITSNEMFMDLIEEDRLEALDDELGTRAKILREYLHPSVLMAGQHNDRSFAIPTNKMIGEATYLVINKRLAEQYDLDLARVRDARDLTDWLTEIQENEPGMALFEGGPLYPVTYEPIFPEFPDFPVQAAAGRSLVYTPEQPPTDPTTRGPTEPTEPLTDEDGELLPTEEPTEEPETTIPPETLPPRATPMQINTEPDAIAVSNQYTAAVWGAFAALNQNWREMGFFESGLAQDRERAAFMFSGTLVDKLAYEALDAQNGFEYEYIMLTNPRASKEDLRSAMFGVSVSTPNPGRAMEIITLLNTNPKFKNIFTYGVEGEHYIYNDDRQIERANNDYIVNTDYTGNHFISDLLAGENPGKWDIAKEHNLSVVNSVFLKFNFDSERLSEESLASLNGLQAYGQEVRRAYLNGLPPQPADFEGEEWTWDNYIFDYVTPEFDRLGSMDLLRNIREQTSPPE